jgi:hypothetical protein
MTLADALKIAEQAKPQHRQPFNKLQGSTTAADLTTGVTALSKSYGAMGNSLSGMTTQLAKLAADVEYLENFTPNSPIRRMHS